MATKVTLDQMKKFVIEHFEEFVNQRKAAVMRRNMKADFYDHDGPSGKPTGVDGDEQMMIVMYKSMPDLHVTIEEMVAKGVVHLALSKKVDQKGSLPTPQLHGLAGRRNELKDLVRHKCSVRELLSRRVDDIALAKSNLFRCDYRDRDICRHGDRLRAVLILDHEGGAAVFLYRTVRHT